MTTNGKNHDVVVFCGKTLFSSTVESIEEIAGTFPHWRLTVFHETRPRSRMDYLQDKLKLWRNNPASVPFWMLRVLKTAWLRLPQRAMRSPNSLPETPAGMNCPNVHYIRVNRLHSNTTLRQIAALKPWLGISLGAPILKKSLFSIPTRGTINVHRSLLPAYRGMPPGFWELHDGVDVTGASIHWIDEKLDTGPVIAQRSLPIAPYTTPRGLAIELDDLGTQVLMEALRQIDKGTDGAVPQEGSPGGVNRLPPPVLAQKVNLRAWAKRQPPQTLRLRLIGAAKSTALLFYVLVYAKVRNAIHRLQGRCHTTVLVYHRVSDAFLDTLTVGVEQFEKHLACLARHYDVVDMSTFLASRGTPCRRPRVVLTFDDGYEDNRLAAMVLRRAGLPCTFFVATRIVGTDRPFPYDLRRNDRRMSALRWDQVRQMRTWGFSIGNHTANHSNLAQIPTEEAVEEVVSARQDLRRELGDADGLSWLAYPFGRRNDITDQVRGSLPDLDVHYCFSAYGGTNPPDFDPLNIRRNPIFFRHTNLRLRATIEGWTWNY
jgi:peptidoglycan/xylan/chitin deacetylase (PgdA/CDA1 family)